jgi:hypothetical protein
MQTTRKAFFLSHYKIACLILVVLVEKFITVKKFKLNVFLTVRMKEKRKNYAQSLVYSTL